MSERHGLTAHSPLVFEESQFSGTSSRAWMRFAPPRYVRPQNLCSLLRHLQPDGEPVDARDVAATLEGVIIRHITGHQNGRLPLPLIPVADSGPKDGWDTQVTQQTAHSCACADLSDVRVEGVYLSGSRREGVSSNTSDNDFMIQLGPFEVHEEPKGTPQTAAGSESALSSAPAQHRLVLQPTEHPGFFRLCHARLPQCQHRDLLLFSPQTARELIASLASTMQKQNHQLTRMGMTGPSQQARGLIFLQGNDMSVDPGMDLVACVELGSGPPVDFARRPRPAGWPCSRLVDALAGTPRHLVPVGFRGHPEQWRASYSRHEFNVLSSMRDEQRACLRILKRCKEEIGAKTKPLKSYYLKTALLWLCETRRDEDWDWADMQRSLEALLQWVAACVQQRHLPCYMDPAIDLLAPRCDAEIQDLAQAVEAMQSRLILAVLRLFCKDLTVPARHLPNGLKQYLQSSKPIDATELTRLLERTWTAIYAKWTLEYSSTATAREQLQHKPQEKGPEHRPDNGNGDWLV